MGRFWAASSWGGRDAQKLWRSSASKIQRRSELPTFLAGGRGNTEAVGQVGLRPSITSIAMLNFVRVFGIFGMFLVFRGVYLTIENVYMRLLDHQLHQSKSLFRLICQNMLWINYFNHNVQSGRHNGESDGL